MNETNSNTFTSCAELVRETPSELCQFLSLCGLAESGGAAEALRRRKPAPGDQVTFGGETLVVPVR